MNPVSIADEKQDITPKLVKAFLPRGVLPLDHPQPIHILLDRFDGKTKDYMVSCPTAVVSSQLTRTSMWKSSPSRRLRRYSRRDKTLTCQTARAMTTENDP